MLCCLRNNLQEQKTQSVTTDLSYWPHPKLIRGSSFDASCWSPSNEAWFIERMNGLRAGTAKLKSQKKWKRDIRGSKGFRERWEATQRTAVAFLAQ